MTTPPADGPRPTEPDPGHWGSPAPSEGWSAEPVSFDKPDDSFNPYRYGAPEQPVPAEYAPPGYTPPPLTSAPPAAPRSQPPPYAPAPQQPGYPGQQHGYAPPPGYTQYPQPRPGNGKAIAALVLGILSIVFFWTTIFDVILIALGIIFGLLGMGDAKRGSGGRGMAISGLVCAIVGALIATIFTVVVYGRVLSCVNKYDRGTSQYNDCLHNNI